MTIEGNHIKAESGKALRRIGDSAQATATDVYLAPNDSADAWEEVEYGATAMKYSTLSIKRELAKLGKWDMAKALLEASSYWDDYVLANYLSEQDEVFKTACSAMVARGIVSQAELDELLPKCVWTAE